MKNNENKAYDYTEVNHLAYCYALHSTRNEAAAKNIASLTAGAFILQEPKGVKKALRSWIFSTAKHHCSRFFRRKQKTKSLEINLKEKLRSSFTPQMVEKDEELHRAYKKAMLELTDMQLMTIYLYYNCRCNYKLMQEMMGVSIIALRKRISRIHKRIKALTNLNKGMLYTKEIVTPELNDVLLKFLERFKKHLENNTLHEMRNYFSKIEIENYNENIFIKKIKKYELALVKDEFDIVIMFSDISGSVRAFGFRFIVENNHLKITVPPRLKKPVVKLENKSDLALRFKQLLHKYPPDPTGKSTIPRELIDVLIRNNRLAKFN